MKDFASFLMIGALCVAGCATESSPASSNAGVQTSAGSAAPSGPAAGSSPQMSAAAAGTKATGSGGAGSAATTTTPTTTAGSGSTTTAMGTTTAGSGGSAAPAGTGTTAAAGSGGSAMAGTTAPMGSFKAAYEMALRDMCMGCHTPDALIASPNLATLDKAYDSLVDKDATTMAPGQCMGMGKLVTPGNCETSLLYNKIAQDMPKCGRHMPLGSDTMPTRLPPAAVEAVCAWIKAGAKKD